MCSASQSNHSSSATYTPQAKQHRTSYFQITSDNPLMQYRNLHEACAHFNSSAFANRKTHHSLAATTLSTYNSLYAASFPPSATATNDHIRIRHNRDTFIISDDQSVRGVASRLSSGPFPFPVLSTRRSPPDELPTTEKII